MSKYDYLNQPWKKKGHNLMKANFGNENAFCHAAGVSPGWLNHKLHERRKPTLEDLELIATTLGITTTELIADDDQYLVIKRKPEGSKKDLIHQIQETAAEYIVDDDPDLIKELQNTIDMMSGKIKRLKE